MVKEEKTLDSTSQDVQIKSDIELHRFLLKS